MGNDSIDSGIGADRVEAGDDDDWVFAGYGLGDTVLGESGHDTLWGSHDAPDLLLGGDGNDQIRGQGGNDDLWGEAGHDHVDGGAGIDSVRGGEGDDEILGGGGAGDLLLGEGGHDVIRGSDDGADVINGGPGSDLVFANGGNDVVNGGADDDVLHGGAGDDVIEGDAGSDVLTGDGHHDTLYGHTIAGVADDNAVDYLYGDYGTHGGESDAGRDRIFGGGGNDRLFGEGENDAIDAGAGVDDRIDYGAGFGGPPEVFVPPATTPNPVVQSGVSQIEALATLPDGPDYIGRWRELAGSASGGGLSDSGALALESVIATDAAGARYVAWVDGRNGNFDVYVAKNTDGAGWEQLAGSAERGGVSNTATSSRRPSIVIDTSGNPIVVWTEFNADGAQSNIRAAKFDPSANAGAGGWVALGDSLDADGLSNSDNADHARVVATVAGPTVVWFDGATADFLARRFNGTAWQSLGGGITGSALDQADFSVASDGARVAIGWSAPVGGAQQVFVREWDGAAWRELAGSASGNGVSDTRGRLGAADAGIPQRSIVRGLARRHGRRSPRFGNLRGAFQWLVLDGARRRFDHRRRRHHAKIGGRGRATAPVLAG